MLAAKSTSLSRASAIVSDYAVNLDGSAKTRAIVTTPPTIAYDDSLNKFGG